MSKGDSIPGAFKTHIASLPVPSQAPTVGSLGQLRVWDPQLRSTVAASHGALQPLTGMKGEPFKKPLVGWLLAGWLACFLVILVNGWVDG